MKRLLLSVLLVMSALSYGQVIMSENFNAETFPPTGWTRVNTHATNNWIRNAAGQAIVNWVAGNQDESLISPTFSLVGQNAAYFNFTAVVGYEYMVSPFNSGNLFAKISTDGGTTWTTLWVEENEGVFVDYSPRYKHLNLSAYLGQSNLKIKFQYVANDADLVRIDDVSITNCPTVDNIALTALTDNTATTTWSGTSGSYDFEWGPVGFTQGTGTVVSNLTIGTFSFSELTAGSGYSYYVKSNCDGLNSGWQGPYSFYTTLSTTTDLNYNFGFEAPTLESAGWTTTEAATGSFWDIYTASGALVQEGTSIAGCFGSTSAATNAWLFSRGMNLVGGSTVTFTYYVRKYTNAGNGGTNNSMTVKIGTARTAVAQTVTLKTHANLSSTTHTLQTATYVVPATGVYYVGFNCTTPQQTTANNGAILVDAFSASSPLGVNDFISDKFTVFPNPTKDILNISSEENLLFSNITINDLNGREIKSIGVNSLSNTQLNIADLASGMYLINIATDQGKAVKKIIKD